MDEINGVSMNGEIYASLNKTIRIGLYLSNGTGSSTRKIYTSLHRECSMIR